MAYVRSRRYERGTSAAIAAGVTAAIGLALALGLVGRAQTTDPPLPSIFQAFAPAEPLRQKAEQVQQHSPRRAGDAAPPNLRAQPTEIVAPQPLVPLPVPPEVAAAPVAGPGVASQAGAAEVPGPGTGAGGIGDGTGSGGEGDGDGGGGGDETPPRLVRGSLRNSDYPEAAADAGAGGAVGVRYLVGADGRVAECGITHSSGSPILDDTTCRLIRERFRFRPSRDGRGRPVPAWIIENHEWVLRVEKSPEPERRKRRVRVF